MTLILLRKMKQITLMQFKSFFTTVGFFLFLSISTTSAKNKRYHFNATVNMSYGVSASYAINKKINAKWQ